MIMKSNELSTDEFVNLLMNQEITVYEDIQGSKIWCNYENNKWNIRPKSISQNPINFIDLAMQKLYKYVWAYLLSISENVTQLLSPNMFFCFEYFPDFQPAHIKYNGIPKNRLILTCVCKNGKNYVYDTNELKVFASLLEVEMLPIIYKGKLSKKQILNISSFISTSVTDLEYLHNETNFAKFFYNELNPNVKTSYLQDNFQDNLEKIIIRFEKDYKTITLDILNPMYKRNDNKIDSNYSDIYSILIFNFLEFLYSIEIDDIIISGRNREIIYVNLMCELYNKYMSLHSNDINELDFIIPDFFNEDKFKINQLLISNELTLDYINRENKNEYLLKIILNTFKNKQNKKIGIFTDLTLKYLNDIIRKIHIKIEELFNYNINFPSYLIKPDLANFPNIKWEEDGKGYVKTKQGQLFDDTLSNNNNNKKKFKK